MPRQDGTLIRLPYSFQDYRFLTQVQSFSTSSITQFMEHLYWYLQLPITDLPTRVGGVIKLEHNDEFTRVFFSELCLTLLEYGYTRSDGNVPAGRLDTSHLSRSMLNDVVLHPGLNVNNEIIEPSSKYYGSFLRRTFTAPVSVK